MSYRVIAPCVVTKDREGKNRHRYEGDVIAWLSDEQAEHFVSSALVEEIGSVADESNSDDAGPDGGGRPTEDDSKADLVAWVLANAIKDDGSEYSESELNRLNKGQLVELINSVPDDPGAGSEE